MNSIPTYILTTVAAPFGCDRAPIQDLCLSTANLTVIVQWWTSIPTASHYRLFKSCISNSNSNSHKIKNCKIVNVDQTSKVHRNGLTVFRIVCNEVRFYREDINICDICISILALQLFTESMKLQIESFSSLVVCTNTSLLIELWWVCSEFGNILSQAPHRTCVVYPKVPSPLIIQSLKRKRK